MKFLYILFYLAQQVKLWRVVPVFYTDTFVCLTESSKYFALIASVQLPRGHYVSENSMKFRTLRLTTVKNYYIIPIEII